MTQGSGGVNLGEGGRESGSLRVHELESLPARKIPQPLGNEVVNKPSQPVSSLKEPTIMLLSEK